MPKPTADRKKPTELEPATASAIAALTLVRDGTATEAQVEKGLAELRKRDDASLTLLAVLVEQGVLPEKKAKELEKKLDPELIPGYRILGEVGKGGMGAVYKARQLSMDRAVALKVLSKRLSEDARYVEKFLHEARAAGKLNHENIVSAIDCGAANGIHYFVMEYVDGEEVMKALAREGPLPWEKAFEIGEQVARALDHAHRNGLVHRDVKPENILWIKPRPDEPPGLRVKLCDLGLAKQAVAVETGEKSKTTEGTPYYCSPEQALGRTDVDGRSDIYSLGATLYHLLSGEPPFDGENARQILWKQVHRPFPDLAEKLPHVPEAYRAILERMVAKDRDERLPSAQAFLEAVALERTKAQEAARPRPQAPAQSPGVALVAAAGSLALLIVVSAVAWVALRQPKPAQPVAQASPAALRTTEPRPSPVLTSGPTLVRVDSNEGPKPDASPSPSSSGSSTPSLVPAPSARAESAEGKAAQVLLDAATAYQGEHPDDLSGYTARLRSVMEQYPGTPAAVVAEKELNALASVGLASFDREFTGVQQKAQDLDAQGKWKDAIGLVDALCEKTDARLLAPRKADIEKFRATISGHALARVESLAADAVTKLLKGQPIDDALAAIQALEAQCPAAVAKDAEAKVADLKKRALTVVADGVLAEVAAHVEELLAAGKLDEAKAAGAALKDDERVKLRPEGVAALEDELARIDAAWHAFDDHVKAIESAAKRVFKRRAGPDLDGQLRDYDTVTWQAKVKPFGLRETFPLDLHDLVPDELVAIALEGDDVLKNGPQVALYFVARREPDAATKVLEKVVLAGGADDPALRARIARVRARAHDQRAQALVDKALAPNAVSYAADDVIATIRQLAERYADAKPYLDNLDELRRVYVAARTMRLSGGDVAALFSGRLTRGKELVKLEYDFAQNEGGARDWAPDTTISKDSSVRVHKGRLLTRGKARNVAVWEPGTLVVDARVVTPSGARPNVNLIICEKPGWHGVLVGFGFIYGQLSKIRVEPSAPRKPGYTIPLPANVIYELENRPPELTGKCWAAEVEPVAPVGRAIHYIVKRDARGGLRGIEGSQNPVSLPVAPLVDQAGSVAIAGFETELGVEHVTIEGKLDQTWLGDRARQIATAEAAAFPGTQTRTPAAPAKSGG